MDITGGGGGTSLAAVGALVGRPFRSGGTFYAGTRAANVASTVLTQNNLYAAPFLVPVTTTFSSIGVTSTGVASTNVRLGIYRDVNGVPNTLVLDAGSVSTTTTAFQSIAISQSLTAGWYWLACAVQGGAASIFGGINNYDLGAQIASSAPGATGPVTGYSQTGVSGALPAPWGATFTETGFIPWINIAAQ